MYLTDGTIKNRQKKRHYSKKIPIRRNYVLPGLGYSIDLVIQADTPIKQCCNFSRVSSAFETGKDIGIKMVVYFKTRDNTLSGVVYQVKSTVLAQSPVEFHMRI